MEKLENLVSLKPRDFFVPFQFNYLGRAEEYESQYGTKPSIKLKKSVMRAWYVILDGSILGIGSVGVIYLIHLLQAPH